jgi:transcription initiation factor IIE alpha subunit
VAEVAHLSSVEQHITVAIKNSIDFQWIRCIGYSLHHQKIVNSTVTGLTRTYISWWCKQVNRLNSETVRQRTTKRKMQILEYL